jgi:hypothetical protein
MCGWRCGCVGSVCGCREGKVIFVGENNAENNGGQESECGSFKVK